VATLRRALLRSTSLLPGGCGFIVFFAKNGECDEWIDVCRRLGRAADVIRVTPGSRYQFNFMDWIAAFGGEGGDRGPIPTVSLLEEIASAVSPESAGAGNGENAFFSGAKRDKLMNIVHLIQLAKLRVTLLLMEAISNSAPTNQAQAKDRAWQKDSVCWQVIREAEANTANDPEARKDFEVCKTYFLVKYPLLSDRTRGVIEIMFSGLVRPFLTRPLRPIFCEGTNITPEMCFTEGKIILCDFPVAEYSTVGRLAALAFKRCFQLAILRRSGPPGSLRPAVWFCDEAQLFVSPGDIHYAAVSRSAGAINMLFTQSVSAMREALGSADRAENLLSNMGVKIFTNCSGETARWASELIGARYTKRNSISIGHNAPVDPQAQGSAGGTSGGVSRSEEHRPWVLPSEFQTLRRGGLANRKMVDTIIYAAGKTFTDNGKTEPQPFKRLAFEQE